MAGLGPGAGPRHGQRIPFFALEGDLDAARSELVEKVGPKLAALFTTPATSTCSPIARSPSYDPAATAVVLSRSAPFLDQARANGTQESRASAWA